MRTYRANDRADEIAFVAERIGAAIAAGIAPERIALVHRTARCMSAYEDALVDAGIAVAPHGDIDLLARPEAADALAALWAAVDPYRHAWLLRTLVLPMLALGDISLGILCGEPANPQEMLFPVPATEPEGDRRWDRRRDVRLAMNVLRGERDADLSPLARERLVAFRERRAAWAVHARDTGTAAARAIVEDAGLYASRPGETPARAARRAFIVDAVLTLIDRYAARHPGSSLEGALTTLERIAPAERGPVVHAAGSGVFAGEIACIGPRRFEHVFVVDARAGSFPPYYVPDAFLFSPGVRHGAERSRRRCPRRPHRKIHVVLAHHEAQRRLRPRTSPLAGARHAPRRRRRHDQCERPGNPRRGRPRIRRRTPIHAPALKSRRQQPGANALFIIPSVSRDRLSA